MTTAREWLDAAQARSDAATEGPWFYNGYAGIFSKPQAAIDEAWWTEERLNDGHTYDHRVGQTCPSCGERWMDVGGERLRVWDCQRSGDALDVDCHVASVPASYGDTATGVRIVNAQFIADARTDVPAMVAALRAVVDLHKPWTVYGECDCAEDDKRLGHVFVEEIGETCRVEAIVCEACCSEQGKGEWHAEECATYHEHRDGQPICATVARIEAALGVTS